MAWWAALLGVAADMFMDSQDRKNAGKATSSNTGYESYSRGSIPVTDLLRDLIAKHSNTGIASIQSESLARARLDSAEAVEGIFKEYSETALPQIYNAQNQSGVYGSTTGQLLTNDAFARANTQASELTLGLANTYASQRLQQQAQEQQMLAQLFDLDANQTGRSEQSGTARGTQGLPFASQSTRNSVTRFINSFDEDKDSSGRVIN